MLAPQVVIDTSVLRAGVVSGTGASRRLLAAALAGEIMSVASTALMLEYEEVLLRSAMLERAGLAARDALALLDGLCAVCRPTTIRTRWKPQSPDPSDNLVLEAAANGLADTITTFNLRNLRAPAARFGIAAETPADVLRRILS